MFNCSFLKLQNTVILKYLQHQLFFMLSASYNKWRVRLPNRMNFQKNSKRTSTPSPHFRKIMLQLFYDWYGCIYVRRCDSPHPKRALETLTSWPASWKRHHKKTKTESIGETTTECIGRKRSAQSSKQPNWPIPSKLKYCKDQASQYKTKIFIRKLQASNDICNKSDIWCYVFEAVRYHAVTKWQNKLRANVVHLKSEL